MSVAFGGRGDGLERSVLIRVATADDAGEIASIYRPIVEETIISFETNPPSAAEFRQRIARTTITHPWLVAEEDVGKLLGYAYASRHRDRAAYRWAVDVSVYVREDARRMGVGGTLYRCLFGLLTMQGFAAAYAGIALPNEASVGLHESLGFTPVGTYRQVGYKLAAWHDVGWWELSLRGRPTAPAEPRLIADLAAQPDWQEALDTATEELRRRVASSSRATRGDGSGG